MKKITLVFLLALSLISCGKNELSGHFDCEDVSVASQLKKYRDFLKHFYIEIPANWNTKLYYDEYSSTVYAADTTKSLTNTYVLDVTWRQGELNMNDAFKQQMRDSVLNKESLTTLKEGQITFKEKPGYFNLANNTQSKYDYHFLQVYVKTGVDEYIVLSSKVYGDRYVEERLCESIAYFNNLKLIE